MLQHAQRPRGWVDNEALSVVGHDTVTPCGLEIGGSMHVGARTQHLDNRHRHYMRQRYVCFEPNLVWLVQVTTQRSGLAKKWKVKGTEVVSR
jgi:hypothetical protein